MEYQRKKIKGFDGYEIDTHGVVYSCRQQQITRDKGGKIIKVMVCESQDWEIIPQRVSKKGKGYLSVRLGISGKRVSRGVHRLLAAAFLDNPAGRSMVCHRDGNRFNNSLGNLYWGTAQSNSLDAIRHGTHQGFKNRGEKSHFTKLTPGKVLFIKRACSIGVRQWLIAKTVGVSNPTISDIKNGKSWKHITLENNGCAI